MEEEDSGGFNETHPEMREGELFLINATWAGYERIRWKTKRRGLQAYTEQGEEVTGYIPVFVQRKEFNIEK